MDTQTITNVLERQTQKKIINFVETQKTYFIAELSAGTRFTTLILTVVLFGAFALAPAFRPDLTSTIQDLATYVISGGCLLYVWMFMAMEMHRSSFLSQFKGSEYYLTAPFKTLQDNYRVTLVTLGGMLLRYSERELSLTDRFLLSLADNAWALPFILSVCGVYAFCPIHFNI